MATTRKAASNRLQALQAEANAEQGQAAKPLASYFSAPDKSSRKSRAAAASKPGA